MSIVPCLREQCFWFLANSKMLLSWRILIGFSFCVSNQLKLAFKCSMASDTFGGGDDVSSHLRIHHLKGDVTASGALVTLQML